MRARSPRSGRRSPHRRRAGRSLARRPAPARAGVADPRRHAGRDEAVDGRAAHEGCAGAVLHRVRGRRHASTRRVRRGSARSSRTRRGTRATLRVEVRVGDYDFDSSRFVTQDRGGGVGAVTATPRRAARRRLRRDAPGDLAHDRRGLQARASTCSRARRRRSRTAPPPMPLPDFSKETPVETVLPGAAAGVADRDVGRSRAAALGGVRGATRTSSAPKCRSPTVARHALLPEQRRVQDRRADSARRRSRVRGGAGRRRHAGPRDVQHRREAGSQDLPPIAGARRARARARGARVDGARTAPVGEEFTGPVLLEGEASAELIAADARAADAGAAPAGRRRIRGMAQRPASATPFLTRIGLRVLADSFSASDTPSLTQFNGRPVAGRVRRGRRGRAGEGCDAGRKGPAASRC